MDAAARARALATYAPGLATVGEEDASMLRLRLTGSTLRQLGRGYGLAPGTVHKRVARGATYLAAVTECVRDQLLA